MNKISFVEIHKIDPRYYPVPSSKLVPNWYQKMTPYVNNVKSPNGTAKFLNDLNIELGLNIHLIPFGRIFNKEQVEFSTTHLPLVSDPNEEVHLPIEVWLTNFKQNRNVIIDVYVDGVFLKKQKVSFDSDHTYVITDVMVKSPKLGKHQIKVILDNGLSTLIDWNVVNEKAIVYGFSDALDPDVGVLNRVAKNKFIKLLWNFDLNANIPDQADKFIFLRILPRLNIQENFEIHIPH